MLINPPFPVFQTVLFAIALVAAILLTLKKDRSDNIFSTALTTDLKGFAILVIILSHIGYFLSQDNQFLFPLSILAGVGVNLFLFLSGFGLTLSALQRALNPWQFFKKRLIKIFIPMWVVLIILLTADFILLHLTYPLPEVIHSFLGYFPYADLYKNIDSPLWYFSLILFYYLIYPFIFVKRLKFLSPLIIFAITYFITQNYLIVGDAVNNLYKLHLIAFPAGITFALLLKNELFTKITSKFKDITIARFVLLGVFLWILQYTAINSGVGQGVRVEQQYSLITTAAVVAIFALARLKSFIFGIFGEYSYEVYLFHWPLLYHFDFLYKYIPAFLATIIYLVIFVVLAKGLRKLTNYLTSSRIFLKSSL